MKESLLLTLGFGPNNHYRGLLTSHLQFRKQTKSTSITFLNLTIRVTNIFEYKCHFKP